MTELKIGRSKDCDIFIDDPTVSRVHAILTISDRIYSIRDSNSANGTFINGNRITDTYILRENDIVKIGNTVLPWKNYTQIKKANPSPAPAASVTTLPGNGKKRKPLSGVVIAGSLVVTALIALVVYFFVISRKDELRISDTWICDKNCGSISKIVFDESKNKSGSYSYFNGEGQNEHKGTYYINTDAKLLQLIPGMLAASDSVPGFSRPEETYKYDMSRNNLSLIPWQNGARSGGQMILVKLR